MVSEPPVYLALVAGAISFLSPCVLPLVPGYLSAVTGVSPADLGNVSWRRVVAPSLLFIASFSVIFVILGLTATGLGSALQSHRDVLNKVAGALIVAMGVLFVASLFVTRLNREWRVEALLHRAGAGGPIIAGAAFAVAWTPCIGPTLASILGLAASRGSVGDGALLLAVYSAGLGIPFLLSAIAFTRMTTAFAALRRYYPVIIASGGAILIVMGVLVWTGEMFRLNIEVQRFMNDLNINFFSNV